MRQVDWRPPEDFDPPINQLPTKDRNRFYAVVEGYEGAVTVG
jgi:hypothetical protein